MPADFNERHKRKGRMTNQPGEEYDDERPYPHWLRDFRILPSLGPWKMRVTIDGFDASEHPGEPRPDPLWSLRVYPPGTLNL